MKNFQISEYKFFWVLLIFVTIRSVGLCSFPPFADENLNILTGFSDDFRSEVKPELLGRDLLSYQFFIPAWIEKNVSNHITVCSARYFVVFFSTLSLILWYKNISTMYGTSRGLLFSVLVTFNPYFWLHDRLALQDSFFGFIWGLLFYFAIISDKIKENYKRKFFIFLCGVCVGLGFLNKITAVLSLPWIFSLLIFKTSLFEKKNFFQSITLMLAGFFVVTIASLDEYFSYGSSLSKFSHTPTLNMSMLFENLLKSLLCFLDFIVLYCGYLFLCIVMLILALKTSNKKENLFHIGLFISIFLEIIAFNNKSYGRYYYSEIIALTIFIVSSNLTEPEGSPRQSNLKKILSYGTSALCVIWFVSWIQFIQNPIYNSFTSISSLYRSIDFKNYAQSWVSGQGTEELIEYINTYKKDVNKLYIFVYSHSVSGSRALSLRYLEDPRVKIIQIPFYTELELENIGHYVLKPTDEKIEYLFLHETISTHDVDVIPSYNNYGISKKLLKDTTVENGNRFQLFVMTSFDRIKFFNSFPMNNLDKSKILKPNSYIKAVCESDKWTIEFANLNNVVSVSREGEDEQIYNLNEISKITLHNIKKDEIIKIHPWYWSLTLEDNNVRTGYHNIYKMNAREGPQIHGVRCDVNTKKNN